MKKYGRRDKYFAVRCTRRSNAERDCEALNIVDTRNEAGSLDLKGGLGVYIYGRGRDITGERNRRAGCLFSSVAVSKSRLYSAANERCK